MNGDEDTRERIETQQEAEIVSEPLRVRLGKFGDPRKTWKPNIGEIDYVARLELTANDIPELLAITRKWAEPMDWPDDEGYIAGYAPIHAWRGLAQLRATEAIPLLLEMLDPLDEGGDDWYLEEFPYVFAWIGPTALGPLGEYLADPAHTVFARVAAGSAIRELAKRHPEARGDAVAALCQALARFPEMDPTLNGFIISDLLALESKESAELIERVYAADRVDVSVNGNWNMVREELGVEGLGLVPEELANVKWTWAPESQAGGQDGEVPMDDDWQASSSGREDTPAPLRSSGKIGRNEPCPCGSGKKYKKCCGR